MLSRHGRFQKFFGHVTENERTVLELLRRLRRQDRSRDHGDADPVSISRLEAALGNRFHKLLDALVAKGYLRQVGNDFDLVGTFNGKFRRLSWDKPSCTVDTRFGSPRYFLHPSQQRGFSVREAARLQGFSDEYIFRGRGKIPFSSYWKRSSASAGRSRGQIYQATFREGIDEY